MFLSFSAPKNTSSSIISMAVDHFGL